MALDSYGDISGVVRVKPPTVRLLKRVYNVDLTAETVAQTLTAAGAYQIGGREWWAKGPASWGSGAVVPGSGVEVGGGAWGPFGVYDWQALFLPFANCPGYEPQLPVTLAFRIACPNLDGSSYVAAGIRSCAMDAAKMTATSTQASLRINGPGSPDYHEIGAGINPVGSNLAGDSGLYVRVESMLSLRIYTSGLFTWTGSLPSELGDVATNLNPVATVPQTVAGTTRPGFFMARNQSAYRQAFLTHLALYQPSAS
jgi:hypothetical protein